MHNPWLLFVPRCGGHNSAALSSFSSMDCRLRTLKEAAVILVVRGAVATLY